MLAVISPAKTLDYQSALPTDLHTQAQLLAHSQELMHIARELSPSEIASLMKISDKLAGLNAARFAQWQTPFSLDDARQAIFAFKGDVYQGLDAYHLNAAQLNYAQQHLGILSGLYGLLKPLDLIQPYRLEMGTKLKNTRGDNLYQFWGAIITDALNAHIAEQGHVALVNLASNEYFKAVQAKRLSVPVITPVFKDNKNGQYKIISVYAKAARGLMARYIIEKQLREPSELCNFDVEGYRFDEASSTVRELVFLRDH